MGASPKNTDQVEKTAVKCPVGSTWTEAQSLTNSAHRHSNCPQDYSPTFQVPSRLLFTSFEFHFFQECIIFVVFLYPIIPTLHSIHQHCNITKRCKFMITSSILKQSLTLITDLKIPIYTSTKINTILKVCFTMRCFKFSQASRNKHV